MKDKFLPVEPLVPLAKLSDDSSKIITIGTMWNHYEALALHDWLGRALGKGPVSDENIKVDGLLAAAPKDGV